MADFKIWMNGRLVLQAEAVLPVNSAAVFYATNVFEGLRAYWNERDGELYGFRLADHFARLRESMKMMRFTVPYSVDDLFEAVRAVLAGNEAREDIHMHLVAYVIGAGLDATSPTGLYINPRRRQRVVEGKGVSACVSSWTRTSDNAIPIRLKCGANYQNGRLARHVLHGAQGPTVHADHQQRHPRVHHADDAHRGRVPQRRRPERRRARDRSYRALHRRRGVPVRQRLRDHAGHVDR